jgi:dipeptidyl aminopeptidase/acylaminoacyl peptidase
MLKFKFLIALFAFVLIGAAKASDLFIEGSKVFDQNTCFRGVFSSYETWYSMIKNKRIERISRQNPDLNKKDIDVSEAMANFEKGFSKSDYDKYLKTLDCVTFEYMVGDAQVEGFLIRPKTDEKLPVIIFNRGGNGNYGTMFFARKMDLLFPIAEKGFAIIGSQYRGTFKPESKYTDEFGGADILDVIALEEIAGEIKNVILDKFGMYGSSRGGMQTLMALSGMDKIGAIVVAAGNFDLEKDLTFRPEMEVVYQKRIPNYAENKTEELRKRSAIKWVEKFISKPPILLLHGLKDNKISAERSIEFAQKLSEAEHPYKLITYPEMGHSFGDFKEQAELELVNWFNLHLKSQKGQ